MNKGSPVFLLSPLTSDSQIYTQFFFVGFGFVGALASKFLGVRRIFTQIFPNLPGQLLCDFCLNNFFYKDY